jgi:hypothetical protein
MDGGRGSTSVSGSAAETSAAIGIVAVACLGLAGGGSLGLRARADRRAADRALQDLTTGRLDGTAVLI